MVDGADVAHLRRCIELAGQAVDAGDEPFGSLLLDADGVVLLEDHNRVAGGDGTRHPELAIAQWAGAHLTPAQRRTATVYTSGEHCPMCAAAHGWAGLGRIVFAASAEQMAGWLDDGDGTPPPVARLPIRTVVPDAVVEGPVPEIEEEVRAVVRRWREART